MSISLSFACLAYDRVLPLAEGRVLPEGIHLNYLPLEVEEIFLRQLRSQEFDVSEEESHYRKTGIFPIMHIIIIKKDIYQKNPWIA